MTLELKHYILITAIGILVVIALTLSGCYNEQFYDASEAPGSSDTNRFYINAYTSNISESQGSSVNLTNPIINGNITTDSDITIVPFTSGKITINNNYGIVRSVNTAEVNVSGGTSSAGGVGGSLRLFGKDEARNGAVHISTPNNAETLTIARLTVTGAGGTGTDWCYADWDYVYQKDLVMDTRLDMDDNYIRFKEMTAPGADTTDYARMYALKGAGDNLTDMAVVFQDGTVDIFAEETTELDKNIFRYGSGTELQYKMIKPHPGLIYIVCVFPDGSYFNMRTLEYHLRSKIEANKGCIGLLPENWVVIEDSELGKIISENTTGNLK